ncbi:metallophosphoesterase family protein [Caryophanon latum]|uniref:Calcineurin-like phosphoesterase domain-containing protein n=1 Tax=Caryophanon latum TaxID=33977 RepID=A0A1C0YD75_9BACL|nr:metallophosphoesterase family protein [Caryophanon latum]OCS85095.1 hypothetical protein A6K76_15385 [Caryophanon latum]
MKRHLAISDIHGQYDELCVLLELANYDAKKDQLVLLGDYIDRGPKSRDVIELVMQLQRDGAIVLSGNHEAIMHAAYTYDYPDLWEHWIGRCRGDATVASYGLSTAPTKQKNAEIERLLRWIPTLPLYYAINDLIFVHAGITEHEPLYAMSKRTLLWSRDAFFKHYAGDKLVIFGHTTTPRLHDDPYNSDVYFGHNRIIGIDGGSSLGGQLHCLEYPSLRVYSV